MQTSFGPGNSIFHQIEGVEFVYDCHEQTFLSTLWKRMRTTDCACINARGKRSLEYPLCLERRARLFPILELLMKFTDFAKFTVDIGVVREGRRGGRGREIITLRSKPS